MSTYLVERTTRGFRLLPAPLRRRLLLSIPVGTSLALLEVAGVLGALSAVSAGQGDDDFVGRSLAIRLGIDSPANQLVFFGTLVVGAFLIKTIGALTFAAWQTRLVTNGEADIAKRLLEGYLHQPYEWHVLRNTAESVRHVTVTVDLFMRNAVLGTVYAISEALSILAIVTVLTVIQPLATGLVAVLLASALVGYVRVAGKANETAGRRYGNSSQRQVQMITEVLSGIKAVKVGRAEQTVLSEYTPLRAELAQAQRTFLLVGQVPRYFFEGVLYLVFGLAAAVIVIRSGSADALSSIAAFVAGGSRVLPSVIRLASALSSIRAGSEAVELLENERNLVGRRNDSGSAQRTGCAAPVGVQFADVTFQYHGAAAPAIDGISIDIRPGSFVGIVGASGAGKTTLVDIMLGLLQPTSGTVSHSTSNGEVTLGYVPQDVFLRDGSIRANVAFGAPDASIDDDFVWTCLHRAELGDVIERFPEGLSACAGERGMRFSGGQRQRIGIARALYSRPGLLVLDEPTAALDVLTESRVMGTVRALAPDVTVVAIAHRLSTVRGADEIIWLDAGRVVATGSFDELSRTQPGFATLVRLSEGA